MKSLWDEIMDAYALMQEHHVAGPQVIAVHPGDYDAVMERLKVTANERGWYEECLGSRALWFGPTLVSDVDVPRGAAQAWPSAVLYARDYWRRHPPTNT